MTIERVIQLAGLVERGNVLPEELAIEFLSEFDGMIQSDIMLHAPEEIVRYDSKDQELILRPPHDGLYLSFLVAMIRQCQDEYEGYNNAQEIVEDKLKTFRRWYIHHYRPADTGSRSYTGGTSGDGFGFAYVSAYGLAVKHGYQGTEEEWLQSLKGAKGDAGAAARMRYDAERDMVQWGVGDEWQDLYTMAQVLAPLYEKLDEMTARVETAAGAAEDAAGTAVEKANQAVAAAEGANQARAGAETAREETTKLRDETRILMQDAETAAQTSRGEAERAVAAAAAGGVKTGEDAPSTETEGRVGRLYLQTGVTPNCLWVCIGADDGVYRWQQCNAYAELDLRDDGDGGVLLVPEGTETEPVLNLYGRHADENVTLRGVAPAKNDTDAPNLRQVQELIGQGGSSGAGYVASEEPPENTKAMWVNTAEPEEAVALGVTAVETAEGVDLYCTDELGTTKVTVRHGKDGNDSGENVAIPDGSIGPEKTTFVELTTGVTANGIKLRESPTVWGSDNGWTYSNNSGKLFDTIGDIGWVDTLTPLTGTVWLRGLNKATNYHTKWLRSMLIISPSATPDGDDIEKLEPEFTQYIFTINGAGNQQIVVMADGTYRKFTGTYIAPGETAIDGENGIGVAYVEKYFIPEGYTGYVVACIMSNNNQYIYADDWWSVFPYDITGDPTVSVAEESETGGGLLKITEKYEDGFIQQFLVSGAFKRYAPEVIDALLKSTARHQSYGKTLYIGGDSLHAYSGGDGSESAGFVTAYNRYLGFRTVLNHGYAGSTWSGTDGGGGIKRVTDLVAAGNPYDVFILAWGTNNDTGGDGTIDDEASNAEGCTMVAAMKWCITQLRTTFRYSAIGVIIPPPRHTNDGMAERGDLMVQVCELLHVPYVDMRKFLSMDDMSSDGVHLGYGANKYGAAEAKLIRDICPYGDPL